MSGSTSLQMKVGSFEGFVVVAAGATGRLSLLLGDREVERLWSDGAECISSCLVKRSHSRCMMRQKMGTLTVLKQRMQKVGDDLVGMTLMGVQVSKTAGG